MDWWKASPLVASYLAAAFAATLTEVKEESNGSLYRYSRIRLVSIDVLFTQFDGIIRYENRN